MRIKRWIVLSLAAALATLMLTGCPWDKEEDPGSSSSSSSSSSRPDDGGSEDKPEDPVTYTVIANIGTGGKVTINNTTIESGSYSVQKGTVLTFTVQPNEGYQIGTVTVNGAELTGKQGTYTYTVNSDCTIAVTFKYIPQTFAMSVTTTPSEGGSVAFPATATEGESWTLTIQPNGGYIVDKVHDNDTDVTKQVENNTYTLTNVTENHTITVTFKLENPDTYPINSREDFMAWAEEARSDPSLSCTLYKDILLPGDWTPIGTDIKNPYTGTFDGKGHTISGLTVTGSDEYAGLFGYIGSGGTVRNVKLENVQIKSDYLYAYVGGVAGFSWGDIENCSVSGSVSGNSNSNGTDNCVGGVVGQQFGGSITGCSSSAIVEGMGGVGGVAGKTDNRATLTACYSTGDVTLESNNSNSTYAGGVVGVNGVSSTLIACYATGNVTGTGTGSGSIYVGGVTGTNDLGTLTACYHVKGTVSGPEETTGGVAGRNFGTGTVIDCYWSSNPDRGIGEGSGDTTKVDDDWTYSPR